VTNVTLIIVTVWVLKVRPTALPASARLVFLVPHVIRVLITVTVMVPDHSVIVVLLVAVMIYGRGQVVKLVQIRFVNTKEQLLINQPVPHAQIVDFSGVVQSVTYVVAPIIVQL